MRLIDGDALEKKLNERYDYLLKENGPYDHFFWMRFLLLTLPRWYGARTASTT